MARTDGMTGGPLTSEPDEGTGQVPDKDKIPHDPDLGDKEKDALVPDRHDPHLGATRSTVRQAWDRPTLGPPFCTHGCCPAARWKGLIHRKLKLGGNSRLWRRPGIRSVRSTIGLCTILNEIWNTCKLSLSRRIKQPLFLELEQPQHQFRLASQYQPQRLPWDPLQHQHQHQLSLLNRHRSQLQFQHRWQLSLSHPDPLWPQFQYQASRLFSQPQEGSPCCPLHLLHYQSHP
uniref:Uncharacterized protein n=1 Tax=Sphaerodactylus townsendi TaxID=933632 RepID=A0ACB8F0Z6_9SAUR